ncbi:hypothetical protein [Pimelobacter simplex]|nr:hypothetical protein [Pimelobacter simplex]
MTGLHAALAALLDAPFDTLEVETVSDSGGEYVIEQADVIRVDELRRLLAEYPADLPVATDSTTAALIERSSAGTPEAVALRASVSDEVAARVVARAQELEADAPAPAPGPSDRAGLSEGEKSALVRYLDQYDSHDDVNEVELYAVVERILADRLAVAEQARDEAQAEAEWAGRGGPEGSERSEDDLGIAKWLSASEAARKAEHHFPADCLAEAALVVASLDGHLHAAEQEAATLRAQVAAVLGVLSETTCNGCFHDDHPCGSEACAMRDRFRDALGDPGPWVDRLKTEGGVEALEQAADALKPRPGKPCERPENCCGTAAQCDAVVPMARVAGEDWLRERARVLRDGEPT